MHASVYSTKNLETLQAVASSSCLLVAGVYIYLFHALCGFDCWPVSVRGSVVVSVLHEYYSQKKQ